MGTADGTVNLNQSIPLDTRRTHTIRVVDFAISSQIPNVYNYGGVNNGLVRVTKNAGVAWTSIQLPNGVYSVTQIQNAINETVSTWYTSSADPGILIRANTALKLIYIVLDSTKLVGGVGQIGIDMSQSLFYELLGFSATKSFIVDGTYTGDVYPQMDYIGNQIVVSVSGFGAVSVKNGFSSNELFRVNLAETTTLNVYTFPKVSQPDITCYPASQLTSFGVTITGSRGRPVYLLEGEVSLSLLLTEK